MVQEKDQRLNPGARKWEVAFECCKLTWATLATRSSLSSRRSLCGWCFLIVLFRSRGPLSSGGSILGNLCLLFLLNYLHGWIN